MSNQHSWFSLSLHKQHILPIQVVEKKPHIIALGNTRLKKIRIRKW